MTRLRVAKMVAAASILFEVCLPAYAGTDIPYVEKPLGTKTAKLPKLVDFSPACEENQQLAQRAATMTPKTSIFISCFVDAKKWRNFREGRSSNLYPLIVITVQVPPPGGNFTPEEFKKLRAAAHNQLGDLLTDTQYAQRQLEEQDRKLTSGGAIISRKNYQQNLQGFFEPIGATSSFSYLTSRSSTISEAGTTKVLREVNAVSTILYSGRLLGLSVIDQTSNEDQGLKAREITTRWLQSFRELNDNSGK